MRIRIRMGIRISIKIMWCVVAHYAGVDYIADFDDY